MSRFGEHRQHWAITVDLEIGDGIYALYMHLRSGSVRVQPGDSVRRGQVIAQLGTSGASASPHLHFQVNEAPWKEGRAAVSHFGEGLPYEHPSFDVLGRDGSPYCTCTGANCLPEAVEHHKRELLSDGRVVRFPGGRSDASRESACKLPSSLTAWRLSRNAASSQAAFLLKPVV